MAIQYNSLRGTVTINANGTTRTIGPDSGVAIVGGYDSNNADASVTEGEPETVTDAEETSTLFGDGCELTRQVETIGGAETIYATAVPETQTTETFAASSTGTLSNVPFFDPNVHPNHSVSVTDSGNNDMTVNIVYVDGADGLPST